MRAMLVKDTGEFQLIETLAQAIAEENTGCIQRLDKKGFRLRLSIGDDAAAWEGPSGVRVLTTDTMVEGVHFSLSHTGWRDLGWRALAVNLSDVAAMGCTPLYAVVTLGLRGDLPVDGLVKMYRGMLEACRGHGGAIAGGDVVRSPTFFVTVALEGAATVSGGGSCTDALLTRDAASAGDRIAVTGSLGCSAGGLRMLTQSLEFDSKTTDHLRDAHNRPVPRVAQGIALARQGVATAIDISDGLVGDMEQVCKASGVGASVRADQVPADEFLKEAYPDEWLDLALSGGEDYELLFTAPSDVMERTVDALDVPVSVIGQIVEGSPQVRVLDQDGRAIAVEHGGWDHFGGT